MCKDRVFVCKYVDIHSSRKGGRDRLVVVLVRERRGSKEELETVR